MKIRAITAILTISLLCVGGVNADLVSDILGFIWVSNTSSTAENQSSSTTNSSSVNGTSQLYLDHTTGSVNIHYTTDYVPPEGGLLVNLYDLTDTSTFPVWSGSIVKTEGWWNFSLSDIPAPYNHEYNSVMEKDDGEF